MPISYLTEGIKKPTLKKNLVSQWIKKTAGRYGKKVGDIAYIFCSDERILEVNKQYLSHDYYTDIITFDYSEDDKISADIFIGLETVASNSDKFGTNFEDELSRVIIHGILHLCGQNDKTDEDQKEMTRKEDLALEEWKKIEEK